MDVADHTAISELKYRYLRTLDTKDWDGFADCFLPEATGDYNGLTFEDSAALVAYMKENLGEGMLTLHQVHHPEMRELDPADDGSARAEGRWYLQDKVIVPAFDFMLEGAAFYSDVYRKTSEGWRVEHTGYRRTFEIHYKLSALGEAQVKGPGEHLHV